MSAQAYFLWLVILNNASLLRPVANGPALLYGVLHIVLSVPGKQMRRISTARIITSMADIHTFRNPAVMQFIAETMSV
jgi:hypothetical protein